MPGFPGFAEFFELLHGHPPFAWQADLAERVARAHRWPAVVALPTGAGKTAVLDIAVHWLARSGVHGLPVPRRVLYVVDRRLVVDSAYERASAIARRLAESVARQDALGEVARALLELGGWDASRPLEVVRLRGGGYIEREWIRNPLQPVVAVSTVDQVGSRLLFRGYGYPRDATNELSVHAGLTGSDAVLFLDEAHLSQAFLQTLRAVERYRTLSEVDVGGVWQAVALTATPPELPAGEVYPDGEGAARLPGDPLLERRLAARKLAELVRVPGSEAGLVGALAGAARRLLREDPTIRVLAVVTNRVQRARDVFEVLRGEADSWDAILLTGRVRPVDRDRLLASWLPRTRAGRSRTADAMGKPLIVVATQTIEVGADLDFDAMVTEMAALDALRQRLGRVDRLGERGESRVVLVAAEEQLAGRSSDPIYGQALRKTWSLLERAARSRRRVPLDSGWRGFEALLDGLEDHRPYLTPAPEAPLFLPGHLDLLTQTSPLPEPDPDVAALLHGFQSAPPDVAVVWRVDLPPGEVDRWAETVALFPPQAGEAMDLPVWVVRRWLSGEPADTSDVEGRGDVPPSPAAGRPCLRWRGTGEEPEVISPDRIRPGDTIVVPAEYGGCDEFGWHAASRRAVPDRGEASAGDRLRLHPATLAAWLGDEPGEAARARLETLMALLAADAREEASRVQRELLDLLVEHASDEGVTAVARRLRGERCRGIAYPDGRGVVLLAPVQRASTDHGARAAAVGRRVTLREHLEGVEARVREAGSLLRLPEPVVRDLALAARLHDLGKAEPRFQAWLYGGDAEAASAGPLLAKSAMDPRDRPALHQARLRAGLPPGWRHEALSVALAASTPALLAEAGDPELVLHLIASHHGGARPFLPGTEHRLPAACTLEWDGATLHADSVEEALRLDGAAERFWRLVRRYGWWGLAYLEAILRLADWRQSEHEQTADGPQMREGEGWR